MHLLPWLALLVAPLCLAIEAGSALQSELANLALAQNGNIMLDTATFDLLTSPRRNWSASIHFTALDARRRCGPCKEFDPAFSAVAKAWTKVPAAERDNHFFATIDFDNGPTVFQKLGLQSAPVVYVYPATEGSHAVTNMKSPFIKYDFSNGFDAAPLAASLSRHTPVPIPYKAPINWNKILTVAGSILPFLLAIRYLGPALMNRWTWAFTTIVTSLVMTSGFMFVRIRGSPHSAADGSWIAGGYSNQYGQEVNVVASIYGLLGASFLMLTLVTPMQTSPRRQRLQIYLWSGVIFVVFSILISLFRVKNRGYPFKLLL